MKVGLVVPGGVDRSGRERVVPMLLWLIERLARTHEIHVFVLDYYPQPCTYPLFGATIHDLGRVPGPPGLRRVRIARRLAAALDACGPFDVLHAYWGMPAGVAATRAARRIGVSVVVTLDSGELVAFDDIAYGLQRRWIDRRAIDHLLRDASAITVPTGFMAGLAALHGVTPAVIPVGIDTTAFVARPRAEGPPWRLIRVGSINAVKDYPTLLRAIVRLSADTHLDIVGEDTLDGAVQALTRDLGLHDRVTFHGWQPTERVAELYSRAHLNIVSSRHESANVTMLESACAGLATVGTAVGYVADWQPDRAVAVATRDPDALAAAIDAMLYDEPRRKRVGEAAREWAVAHDADWTARAFERLYASLVTPRSLPAL
jgi:glycosyltransferase involved in cell wall biosynthesis